MMAGDVVTFVDRHAGDQVTDGVVLEARRDKWLGDLRVFVRTDDGRELLYVHGSEVLAVTDRNPTKSGSES